MSWEGFRPIKIDRFGSLVTNYRKENLPANTATVARNVRYTLNSVATRYGIQRAITSSVNSRIMGLATLVRADEAAPNIPLLFHADGSLHKEAPVGSGSTQPITPHLVEPPTNAYMQAAPAYQRAYMVFGDLISGVGEPAVTDGTNLWPWTQRPIGETWKPSTTYRVGDIVSPRVPNGRIYQATQDATSGTDEPEWSTTGDRSEVISGMWRDCTPFAGTELPSPAYFDWTRVAGAGSMAAGLKVNVAYTFTNAQGETTGVAVSRTNDNTDLNDAIRFETPTIPDGLDGLGGYAPTGWNVYASTGANPVKKQNVAPLSFGVPYQVSTIATTGAVLPTENTARISAGGNVDEGIRYFTVAFVDQFDAISGSTTAFKVVTSGGTRLAICGIPLGPEGTKQRIVLIGPAGGSNGGPFIYIPKDDTADTIPIQASVIDNNTDTAVTVNFTDEYLRGLIGFTDVPDVMDRIKLPAQAHVEYIASAHRFFCFGEEESLVRVSEADKPATFVGSTGLFYAARDNGERAIAAKEFRGEIILFKEHSAYLVQASAEDPATWPVIPRWSKVGVTGPRAVDVGPDFIAWAHRSGAYLYSGEGPVWITEEIQDQWEQINWQYGHKIAVHIDQEAKEVRFAVPFGDSIEPNVCFTMSYKRGLGSPVVFVPKINDEVGNADGRYWSMDDIRAAQMIRVQREISSPLKAFAHSQLLIASPDEEGVVNLIQPDVYDDNSIGILSIYEHSSSALGDVVLGLRGFSLQARGQGDMSVCRSDYSGRLDPLRSIRLNNSPDAYYKRYTRGNSRQWAFRFSNDGQAGSWFELMSMNLYVTPTWASET